MSGQVLSGALYPTHGSIVSKVSSGSTNMPKFLTLSGHLHQGKRPITGENGAALVVEQLEIAGS